MICEKDNEEWCMREKRDDGSISSIIDNIEERVTTRHGVTLYYPLQK